MQFSQKYANDLIVLNEFPTNHFHLNGTSHSQIGRQAIITLEMFTNLFQLNKYDDSSDQ